MGRLRGSTATYATSTTPKSKSYAPTTADYAHFQDQQKPKLQFPKPAHKGDFVPVCVAIGMIALSVSLGLFTATQQLARSPNVYVRKKTRESLPEVHDPDKVVNDAERFLNKSFFRKVAHIQEFDYGDLPVPDPIRKDAYAHKLHVETLNSVGVDPKQV